MDDEIRKLRALLARRERGRGKRYTARLKEKVAVAANELRRRGRSWQRIGRFLGIPHETVRRFASAGLPPALVPVEVAEPEPTAGGMVLVSPEGYRIERLGVADVVEILRRLR